MGLPVVQDARLYCHFAIETNNPSLGEIILADGNSTRTYQRTLCPIHCRYLGYAILKMLGMRTWNLFMTTHRCPSAFTPLPFQPAVNFQPRVP